MTTARGIACCFAVMLLQVQDVAVVGARLLTAVVAPIPFGTQRTVCGSTGCCAAAAGARCGCGQG
jgi:hypothetical protein